MNARIRLAGRLAAIAVLALALQFAGLSSARPANAAIQIESFGFQVTDPGGAPTEQAGGHPDQGVTTFAVPKDSSELPIEVPRNLTVDLPVGFAGNPLAIPTCSEAQLSNSSCPDSSAVGFVDLFAPATFGTLRVFAPLYNLEAPPGVPAQFGFKGLETTVVHLTARVLTSHDYGIAITVQDLPQALPYTEVRTVFWGVPADPSHDELRGACLGLFGTSNGSCPSTGGEVRPFLTNPTACTPSLTATAHVNSWFDPTFATAVATNEDGGGAVEINGCDLPGFAPTIAVQPTVHQGDSPTGLDATVRLPVNEDPTGEATAQLRDATLTFPPGLTVNPASAVGLQSCSPPQVGLTSSIGQATARFDENPVTCPSESKLGTVEIDTPLLADPLGGSVYLAAQKQNPFGSLLAIYIVVEDPRTGILIKLAGHPVADPVSGQLSVSFLQNPQLPFEALRVHLFPGSRAALKTPLSCGSYTTGSDLTPWTSPARADAHPADSFVVSEGANGSACPKTDEDAPNTPSFKAGVVSPTAGAYSPFVFKLGRADGSQPLKGVDATLPKGLLGRLAGIPYCSDAALAVAGSNSGRSEQASPSCPAASRVGSVTVGAGAGETPLYVSGLAYLAGPYKGAPLSLAIVTPAVAGPFDLGTVVVRNALQINPVTTQIHVVSDPIPTILEGIPLDLRSIAINIDRAGFTRNPTNCRQSQVLGETLSVFGHTATLSAPFAVDGCNKLGFKPSLSLALKGEAKRSGNPAVTAVLKMPKRNQANIKKTTVILPKSEFIDNAHISNPCTRVQFAADECPGGSVLGKATAFSPLLDKPLRGKVYFRSNGGERELPDMVVDLDGQIHVTLVGFIDSVKVKGTESSRVRTRFVSVPDAPVSKFVLNLYGGKRGLIENSVNLCKAEVGPASVQMEAQNADIAFFDQQLGTSCGKKKRKR